MVPTLWHPIAGGRDPAAQLGSLWVPGVIHANNEWSRGRGTFGEAGSIEEGRGKAPMPGRSSRIRRILARRRRWSLLPGIRSRGCAWKMDDFRRRRGLALTAYESGPPVRTRVDKRRRTGRAHLGPLRGPFIADITANQPFGE